MSLRSHPVRRRCAALVRRQVHALGPGARFNVPPPPAGAIRPVRQRWGGGKTNGARPLLKMEAAPRAVRLASEAGAQGATGLLKADHRVERQVGRTLRAVARQHAVPVPVAYNIELRSWPDSQCRSRRAAGGCRGRGTSVRMRAQTGAGRPAATGVQDAGPAEPL